MRGVDYAKLIGAKLLPDEAVVVTDTNILTILEKKFQEVQGSADEKLATCDSKLKQYRKSVASIGMTVQFACSERLVPQSEIQGCTQVR